MVGITLDRFGLDVSLLRFVAQKDDAKVYVGPRFTYSRENSSNTLDYIVGGGVVVGLQYRLARRMTKDAADLSLPRLGCRT